MEALFTQSLFYPSARRPAFSMSLSSATIVLQLIFCRQTDRPTALQRFAFSLPFSPLSPFCHCQKEKGESEERREFKASEQLISAILFLSSPPPMHSFPSPLPSHLCHHHSAHAQQTGSKDAAALINYRYIPSSHKMYMFFEKETFTNLCMESNT